MKKLCMSVVCVLLAACATNPGVAPTAVAPAVQQTNQQPVATANTTPPSNTVGSVTGQILLIDETGKPALTGELPIYLGIILKSQTGVEGLVQLDKGVAPKAQPDKQGNFSFINVAPGRYGLMLDTPQGAILLNDQNTGGDFIIEVEGGKIRDLGKLQYKMNMGS